METLRSLFPINDEYLEECQFSKLHKIVLGLASHDLATELAACDTTIDVPDSKGYTPLMWAARRGHHKAVYLLLEAGGSPNLCDKTLITPLMQAAASSSFLCIRFLLQAGADPHHMDIENQNALHHAVYFNGNEDILQCLIAAGVDLEGRTAWGSTPLSAVTYRGRTTLAKFLLDCGVKIDNLDAENDTPLSSSLFLHNDEMTELFLSRGASCNLSNYLGNSVLHLTAMSDGLRTLGILHAATLRNIDTEATNK